MPETTPAESRRQSEWGGLAATLLALDAAGATRRLAVAGILRVLTRGEASPPSSPTPVEGDMHLLGAGANENELAYRTAAGTWQYHDPTSAYAWQVYVVSESRVYQWSGSAWVAIDATAATAAAAAQADADTAQAEIDAHEALPHPHTGTLAQLNSSVSDADVPALAGQLGGTAASPDVRGVRETSGPTLLALGAVADGEYLRRSGSTVVGGTPSGGGASDHGALTGLADDDHTQYSRADGTRAFTAVVSGVTPTVDAHLATKGYVDDGDDANATAAATAQSTANSAQSAANDAQSDIDTHAALTNNPHSTSLANVGSGTLAQLNAAISDADVPALAGQLGGTAASPDVRGLRETAGPTLLTVGAVADGEYLRRSGTGLVGGTPSGGSAASESAAGTAELATQAETNAGTDDARIVTPLKLFNLFRKTLYLASKYEINPFVSGNAFLSTRGQINISGTNITFANPAAGDHFASQYKSGYTTSFNAAAAAVSWSWLHNTGQQGHAWRGNAARRGGFVIAYRLAKNSVNSLASHCMWHGLRSWPGSVPHVGGSDVIIGSGGYTNCIGFAAPPDEAYMHRVHNDSSGDPTAVDLGSDFPVSGTDYLMLLLCQPHDGSAAQSVRMILVNEETGVYDDTTVSTDLPAAADMLIWISGGNSGSGTGGELTVFQGGGVAYLGGAP